MKLIGETLAVVSWIVQHVESIGIQHSIKIKHRDSIGRQLSICGFLERLDR